jgi:hypothetical protein
VLSSQKHHGRVEMSVSTDAQNVLGNCIKTRAIKADHSPSVPQASGSSTGMAVADCSVNVCPSFCRTGSGSAHSSGVPSPAVLPVQVLCEQTGA